MKLDVLHALNAERAARRAAVLVTDVASGEQRLVKAGEVAKDPLKEVLDKRLRMAKSGMEETPQGRFFLTVYVPSPRLVITGAVHISQTLAPIGQLLGYDVTIVDPRTAFASIERFPDVKVIAEWPDVALPPLGIDHYTAFVALTHDPKIDDPALKHALARDCFYIGALGSKKTHAQRVERLKQEGLSDADIARIHAPIGLDIDAVSPAEIAVAIMGEITQVLRQKGGGGMKFGSVPIAEARRRTAVHSIRQGDFVLKKGTLIGACRSGGSQDSGREGDHRGAPRPGRCLGRSGGGRHCSGDRGRGRAHRSGFHRSLQSVRRECGSSGCRQGRGRRAQPHRRGGHAGDAAGLQAGGRRRNDRDREDHSVCGGESRARPGDGRGGESQAGHSRCALQAAQDRRGVHAVARSCSESHRKDP